MPLDFTAIDFETANSSNASACAVGLARVRDGRVVASEGWLIRPPAGHDRFFEINTGIHGITEADVADAPTWAEQYPRLLAFLGDDVLVAHNAGFDMRVLRTACEVTDLTPPAARSLCSVQVSRKTYELPSYRLPAVAAAVGHLDFAHHDATADALACALIVIDAAARAGATDVVELAMLLGLRIPQMVVSAPAEPSAPTGADVAA
ncbi:3'-5' exonuclease [Microbacterium marinum]|uniref:3'-5' exonuclease n=1 Tax=Microbacterium marinum TaxID=421115 RepID=UPI00384C0CFA